MTKRRKGAMYFVTPEDRLSGLTEEDRETLRELEYRCGEHTYSEKSASTLVRRGLAYWIGGEAFLTETGKRVINNGR